MVLHDRTSIVQEHLQEVIWFNVDHYADTDSEKGPMV